MSKDVWEIAVTILADEGVRKETVALKCIIFMSLEIRNGFVDIPCISADWKFLPQKCSAVFLYALLGVGCP